MHSSVHSCDSLDSVAVAVALVPALVMTLWGLDGAQNAANHIFDLNTRSE